MEVHSGLRALLLIILFLFQSYCAKITFPTEESSEAADKEKKFVRSMEDLDLDSREREAGEVYFPFPDDTSRKLKEEDRWNEWEYLDKRKKWSPPDEKTISVQMLDNEPYHHGRPAWPHDEYILGLGYYDLNRTPFSERDNNTNEIDNLDATTTTTEAEDLRKYYEWKRLQQQHQQQQHQPQSRPSPSSFIGPGFYDVGSTDAANTNFYDSASVTSVTTPEYYRYYYPTHQAISTDSSTKIQTSSQSNSEAVPGTPSESFTTTRHLSPYLSSHDLYRRKRLRLQIHPGLIAAPLAGAAAFAAASAFTSKPLLVELGYVRNKPVIPGGWGLVGTGGTYRPYPHFYPPPNPPPFISHGPHVGTGAIAGGIGHSGIGPGGIGPALGPGGIGPGLGPNYPILRPNRISTEGERSSWWNWRNPFSALTPRLILE